MRYIYPVDRDIYQSVKAKKIGKTTDLSKLKKIKSKYIYLVESEKHKAILLSNDFMTTDFYIGFTRSEVFKVKGTIINLDQQLKKSIIVLKQLER